MRIKFLNKADPNDNDSDTKRDGQWTAAFRLIGDFHGVESGGTSLRIRYAMK